METKEKNFIKVWIEDDIAYINLYTDTLTLFEVEEGIKRRCEVTKSNSYPMFVDIRPIKSVSREARERLSQKDAGKGCIAVALLVNSKIQEVLYNFFAAINKPPSPTKLFTNKEKALKWLEQFK